MDVNDINDINRDIISIENDSVNLSWVTKSRVELKTRVKIGLPQLDILVEKFILQNKTVNSDPCSI